MGSGRSEGEEKGLGLVVAAAETGPQTGPGVHEPPVIRPGAEIPRDHLWHASYCIIVLKSKTYTFYCKQTKIATLNTILKSLSGFCERRSCRGCPLAFFQKPACPHAEPLP